MDNLERVHSSIGLLRIQFRSIMNAVMQVREDLKKQKFSREPQELSPFMGRAQELYADLLKASQVMSFAEAGECTQPEALDTVRKTFIIVRNYFQELPEVNIRGLALDPGIWTYGTSIIDETLLMIDTHSQDS